jgi:hypothetical protein
MSYSKAPAKKRPPRKNRVAIDGTLDHLEKIRISIREKGSNAEPFELRIIHKDAMREYVDCNNPLCFNGGFSLGDILREMVAGRQEDFIGTSFCTGQEGNPEEPGPHPSCATRFEIEASIRFH